MKIRKLLYISTSSCFVLVLLIFSRSSLLCIGGNVVGKALGQMQANRARCNSEEALVKDNLLKGEVLMYGTLPIMLPGASHDYKDDVRRVSKQVDLPQVSEEEAASALEQLLGFVPPKLSEEPVTPHVVPIESSTNQRGINERQEKLIDWLVEGLKVHLKRIVAHNTHFAKSCDVDEAAVTQWWTTEGHAVIDEVQEIVEVPHYEKEVVLSEIDPTWVMLDPAVCEQLKDFVTAVSHLYRQNPFHNLEHACNVTMSVSK